MSDPPPAYAPTEPTLDAVYELSGGPYVGGELRLLSFAASTTRSPVTRALSEQSRSPGRSPMSRRT